MRTNSSGRYAFYGVGSGNFRVRVLPYGTDYQEVEEEVQLTNLTRGDASGATRAVGFTREQKDFFLRPRKGTPTALGTPATIFVQADVPENVVKIYEKAITDLDNKKEKQGLEGLKSALEIYPKYYNALERLGMEYIRLGHYDVAEILFNIAIDVNPKGFKSWYGLAYSQYSTKKFAEASTSIQKAIVLNASSPDALLLSGTLKMNAKQFDEAEKHLLKAKELAQGTNPQVHWKLALLYGNHLKRYADAAKELKLFLKAEPNAKDAEKINNTIKEFESKAQAG